MGDTIISRNEASYHGLKVSVGQATGGAPLSVNLQVRDANIRTIHGMDQFDGLEKPFALVPVMTGLGNIVWERRNLNYHYSEDGADRFSLDAVPDSAAAKLHGVAIGIETNTGTLWIQHADQNYRPDFY
jgi:hypothetical protein